MTGIAFAKRAMLWALSARGIASVTIAYDGEGDSGQVGDILAYDATQHPVDIERPVRLALYRGKRRTCGLQACGHRALVRACSGELPLAGRMAARAPGTGAVTVFRRASAPAFARGRCACCTFPCPRRAMPPLA